MFAATSPQLLTPHAALSWEFWRRGRFELLKMVLAGLTVPLVLSLVQFVIRLRLLWQNGKWLAPTEWPPSAHMATLFVQTMVAVLVPLGMLTTLERHWILPVSSRDLARFRLVHGGALAALGMVLGAWAARIVLWVDWPVLVPALYAVTGWTAGVWIRSRFKGQEVPTTLAALAVALVLYGGLESHLIGFENGNFIEHPFTPAGPDEIGLLIGATLLCAWGATRSTELERCGLTGIGRRLPASPPAAATEAPFELSGVSIPTPALPPYLSSAVALFTEEWRQNGRLYPIAAFCTTAFGCLLFLGAFVEEYLRHRHIPPIPPLVNACVYVGILYFVAGPFLQSVATARGRNTLRHGVRSTWMLTLPVSDRSLAVTALVRHLASNAAAAVASALAGLLCWGMLHVVLAVLGHSQQTALLWDEFREGQGQDFFVGLFLLLFTGWVLAGISEASLLAGRRWVTLAPYALLVMLWIGAVVAEIVFGGRFPALLVLVWGLVAVGTLAITAGAVRSGCIPWTWGIAGLGLWLAAKLTWDALVARGIGHREPWMDWAALFAFSTVLLPISLPPLAVAWDRQR